MTATWSGRACRVRPTGSAHPTTRRPSSSFVATRLMGSVYYKADVEYEEGQPFLGGGEQALSGDDAAGAIRALDVMTGEQQWEFMLHSPPWAGVMATAGGLVFGGSNEGNVFALDARNWQAALWDFQTGGAVRTNPMGFAVNGQAARGLDGWQHDVRIWAGIRGRICLTGGSHRRKICAPRLKARPDLQNTVM